MYHAQLPRKYEAALRDLREPKVAVRVGAVHDLARHVEIARAGVVEALVGVLADDAADPVRAAAAMVLGECGAREALGALLAALDDSSVHVQEMALLALGALVGDADGESGAERDAALEQRVLAALKGALAHEEAALRFQALMGYTRLATRSEAIAALLAASHDADERVVHIALRMAEELEGEDGEPVPAELAARAAELVDHDSVRVRAIAAVVAARGGRDEGNAVLVGLVQKQLKTPEAEDEAAAIELCGELGLEAAVPALEKRAFGWRRDPLAWHARVALALMRHPKAVASVLGELQSLSYARRTLAAATAGRVGLAEARPLLEAMRGRPRRAEPEAVEQALAALDKFEVERLEEATGRHPNTDTNTNTNANRGAGAAPEDAVRAGVKA